MPKDETGDVFSITSAPRALSDEQGNRTRKYLFSMGIRTACVIAAIFVPGWPRFAFIAGAILLPYIAVVMANAGRENEDPRVVDTVAPVYRAGLPSSSDSPQA